MNKQETIKELKSELHIFKDEHYREMFHLLLDCAEKQDDDTFEKIIATVRLAIRREKAWNEDGITIIK